MALKHQPIFLSVCLGFGGILNNMALKLADDLRLRSGSFGGILNNMALKPCLGFPGTVPFWWHSKQHGSKTSLSFPFAFS